MRFSRRSLLQSSGYLLLAGAASSRARAQAPSGADVAAPRGKKALVVVFQRGGADGLSMVPPVGDGGYYALRPTLALARPGAGDEAALPLDDTFGLHPALAPLRRFYAEGTLAFVQAVGSPRPTRSHFDAQDFVDAGTPGERAHDGWLNRALSALPPAPSSAFRAVALTPTLPRSLVGEAPAISLGSLAQFKVGGGKRFAAAKTFEALYATAVDAALRTTGADAFDALKTLDEAQLSTLPPDNGAQYPASPFGRRMADLARLVKADVGLQVATTDVGGWDTHIGQGAAKGQLAARLKDYAAAMEAFATDLGPRLADVCVVTLTEFGRTVRENGNRGTDHGTASVMSVLGGNVRGGRVAGRWPGLSPAALFEGRDLAVTTDFREVLAEALRAQLGLDALGSVFPGFAPSPQSSLRLFG